MGFIKLLSGAGGASAVNISNATTASYVAASGEIPANTFVTISDNKISFATDIIHGYTISNATTTKAAKVLVYGG